MANKHLIFITFIYFFVFGTANQVHATGGVPAFLPFDGRLTDAAGGLITTPTSVSFRIYPPSGNCYVYEDTQVINPNSMGLFSATIGDPAHVTGPANSFSSVFSNDSVLSLLTSCVGVNYSPAPKDWRRLEMVVAGVALSGMQTIGSAAFAINSNLLDGKSSGDFILSTGSVNQLNLNSLTNSSDASALHHHDNRYLKSDGSTPLTGSLTTPSNFIASGVSSRIGVGTGLPMADLHVVKDNPSVLLQANSGTNGQLQIGFNSGLSQRGAIKANEASNGLQFYSGNTQAMAIDGLGNLILSGSLTLSGTTGLGRYSDTQEASLIAGLTPVHIGTLWANSTSGNLKYWDGTSVKTLNPPSSSGITSLNGLTLTAQAFAIGSSGVTPSFSSVGATHTLNLPMASSASVTSGLLSNVDFVAFTNKVNKSGDTLTGPLVLNSDPTVSLGASTKQYVDTVVASSGASYVRLDGTAQTVAGNKTFSGTTTFGLTILGSTTLSGNTSASPGTNHDFSSAASLKVPVAAGATPTLSGLISYDSTLNVFKVGMNGNTLSLIAGDLSVLPTAGQVLAYDGITSRWKPASQLTSLNGLTSIAQTFGVGSSGTAPAFASNASTHTLNIPLASAAGVTAGLLSKNDYDIFFSKFGNGGNSFGGTASLGTADNNSLNFITNALTRVSIDPTGRVGINQSSPTAALDVNGHIANSSASSPTIGTCGTNPSITGNDTRGIITLGTGSPTACTITFSSAYVTTPICVVSAYQIDQGSRFYLSAITTTGFTLTQSTGASSKKFTYLCIQ